MIASRLDWNELEEGKWYLFLLSDNRFNRIIIERFYDVPDAEYTLEELINAEADEKVMLVQEYGGPFFVNTYRIEHLYGGPEEGGWWYDQMIPDDVDVFPTYLEALISYDRLSRKVSRENEKHPEIDSSDYDGQRRYVYMDIMLPTLLPYKKPTYE